MSKRKPPRSRIAPRQAPRPPQRAAAQARGDGPGDAPGRPQARSGGEPQSYWIYGEHAVRAALANPGRQLRTLLIGQEAGGRQAASAAAGRAGLEVRSGVPREAFSRLLPDSAVHQGIALEALPLRQPDLESLPPAPEGRRSLVVLLDQVTDPQNVGAILRSACAFGARAVVATDRNAAAEGGLLAKAASGALEAIPYIRVTNLVRALERLKAGGHWSVGLSAEAGPLLADLDLGSAAVLVLGSEGRGLRRLTAEHCDFQARLPTLGALADLNVSNAAAVALYELLGRGA